MAAKSGSAEGWSSLVTVESYRSEEGQRQVLPRIQEIERALQQSPSANEGLVPVLVLKGTISDDGTHGSWTVKTFARTNHVQRRVVVTLDIVSEPRTRGMPHEPFDRPLVVTVRPDPLGSAFCDSPYEVVIQTSERRPIARTELVLSDAA
jgi:hypothetical protein